MDYRANRSRPTLKTISALTGLGVTTVSRALKNGPELSLETRTRVQAIAAELGYRPDRAGVRLRTGRTFVIGLILDQSVSVAEFERRIIMGVSRVLRDTSYHLVVMPQPSRAEPLEPIRYFVETQAADGLIFTHTQPHDPRVRYLLDRQFPFITHGRTDLGDQHPYYDLDTGRLTAGAARHLIERGRRRLALIEPPRHLTCHAHAIEGFAKTVSALGVDAIVAAGVHLDESPANFRAAGLRLARQPDRPDGIICANETGCVALMAGLRDGGLTIGRDIDVVAKGTSDLLDHIHPAIDSFFEDLTFAGEELARLLLRRIAGAPVAELQSLSETRLQRRT
jgi:LacI family transcriptional regulator